MALPDYALRIRVGGQVETTELAAVSSADDGTVLLLLLRSGCDRGRLPNLRDGHPRGACGFEAERGVEVRLNVREVRV